MKRLRENKQMICRTLMAACMLLFVQLAAFGQQDTELSVVSSLQGPPEELKLADLKAIFNFEKQRWHDGTKVVIVMMKTTTPVGQSTCQKVYGMSGQGVLRLFSQLQFAGKIDKPILCNTMDELLATIADNPGAIGIAGKVADSPNVKTILINGKKTF